jgi:hypothetical protein
MIRIQVIDEETEQPDNHALVGIVFEGIAHGHTGDQWTDGDGYVEFDVEPARGTISVNHNKEFTGWIDDEMEVYI